MFTNNYDPYLGLIYFINLLTDENTRTQIINEIITPRIEESLPINSFAKKAQRDATTIAINIGIYLFL